MPSVRAKSQPVPRGITAISTPSRRRCPFTTSLHGAVAADDDEPLGALVGCPPREVGQLSGRA